MKIILMEEPEIATVGTKGQVVIPQQVRKELGIAPRTKLAIYTREGKIVAAKVEVPSPGEELRGLFREIDKRNRGTKKPSEREILAEIQEYRRTKRANRGI